MRKLCTVRSIANLLPIENADKIELALIDGWECVVKKREFEEGDLCLYFEIDSILPEKECFEFMRQRKFRVRTIKLRKQISQGLALHPSILIDFGISPDSVKLGDDLTEKLGIKKYDPEATKEVKMFRGRRNKKETVFNKFIFKVYNYIRGYGWVSNIYKYPRFIKRTDEERIQNIPQVLIHRQGESHYITEKLDGSSSSYAYYKGTFYVCSRNRCLRKSDDSVWWQIAKKYDIEKKLKRCHDNGLPLTIQGEIIGLGVQNNKYQLKELDFYIFNVISIKDNTPYGWKFKETFCKDYGFKFVPLLDIDFIFSENLSVHDMVEKAKGKSVINPKIHREGIVVRLNSGDQHSFKVINPEFLLKYEGERG